MPRAIEARPLTEYPEVMTIPEAAGYLRVGINAAYELVRLEKLHSVHLGRRVLVPRWAVERLVAPAEGGR